MSVSTYPAATRGSKHLQASKRYSEGRRRTRVFPWGGSRRFRRSSRTTSTIHPARGQPNMWLVPQRLRPLAKLQVLTVPKPSTRVVAVSHVTAQGPVVQRDGPVACVQGQFKGEGGRRSGGGG